MNRIYLRIVRLWSEWMAAMSARDVELRPVPVRVHRAQRWRRR